MPPHLFRKIRHGGNRPGARLGGNPRFTGKTATQPDDDALQENLPNFAPWGHLSDEQARRIGAEVNCCRYR
jgi:hypothetical protein